MWVWLAINALGQVGWLWIWEGGWIWEMKILYSSVLRGTIMTDWWGMFRSWTLLWPDNCAVCPPSNAPRLTFWNPNAQCDGVKERDGGEGRHWDVMSLWRWGLHEWVGALIKETLGNLLLLLLHQVRTQWEGGLQRTRKFSPAGRDSADSTSPGLPSLQNSGSMFLLFIKPPRLV